MTLLESLDGETAPPGIEEHGDDGLVGRIAPRPLAAMAASLTLALDARRADEISNATLPGACAKRGATCCQNAVSFVWQMFRSSEQGLKSCSSMMTPRPAFWA